MRLRLFGVSRASGLRVSRIDGGRRHPTAISSGRLPVSGDLAPGIYDFRCAGSDRRRPRFPRSAGMVAMESRLYKRGSRLVSIVRPTNLEEYRWAVGQGFCVATTRRQREDWDLVPSDDVPVRPSEEIVELTFLAPEDEAFEDEQHNPNLDTALAPEEEAGEIVEGPDGEFYKVGEDGEILTNEDGDPVPDDRFERGVRRVAEDGEPAELGLGERRRRSPFSVEESL